MLTHAASGQVTRLEVEAGHSIARIQPTMYGIFFEDINFAADGGLYAEMVKNRGFEFYAPMMGWKQPNSSPYAFNNESGIAAIISPGTDPANRNFCRVTLLNDSGYSLINEGFRGMGIKKNARYRLSLLAANPNQTVHKIRVAFIDQDGKVLGETLLTPDNDGWKSYSATLIATETCPKARLRIAFVGNGKIDLDNISLFPEDTWKGRENGLRKDLVQLLADLQPGFLRFPGGCIVEGRTLAKRYQWKKTVGPVWDRPLLINRWNTEFSHRPAPDYFQSFGLGFFEYFQLAEDLGAEPLPILGCGMACQFNTGELVPLDELDPYVQDALDLIEFANGTTDSPWGKVRADMGHPAPFGMKFIGVGNEQWGPEYMERFAIFQKAISEQHPEITIVSGSGPFPEGDFFEYGWEELKKMHAAIIDEHYYNSPEWFRTHATRYDEYDRQGPKVFAGEYAAQSVRTTSPDNKNTWECALAEAAFMTGLERNADVVVMSSYAPLLAHEEGWQWTPDLIWFNNLQAYGTPDYYVQKMFSTNRGTDLLGIHTQNGEALTGQNGLYASSVKDAPAHAVIVKLVNTSDSAKPLEVTFKNQKLAKKARVLTLHSDHLNEVNTFEQPQQISPEESEIAVENDRIRIEMPPYSVLVLKTGLQEGN